MPNETHAELNEKLICSRLSDVTGNQAAWILLQEPGFIGFGVVQSDNVCWSPNVQPDWTRVSDLRLFGEKGEWHVWHHWDGTSRQSRLLKSEDIDDALTEYHVLWGTKIRADTSTSPWVRLVEDRGAEIWLPLKHLKCRDLPLRLKLKQVVAYEEESGLAGVVDAALVALVSQSPHDKVWTPPSCPHLVDLAP